MQILGLHTLIELSGCNASINNAEVMERALTETINALNATLIEYKIHTFSPQGVTAVALLAESHLSLHSWPENNYLAVDFFTCGSTCNPEAAIQILEKYFEPQHVQQQTIERGSNELGKLKDEG